MKNNNETVGNNDDFIKSLYKDYGQKTLGIAKRFFGNDVALFKIAHHECWYRVVKNIITIKEAEKSGKNLSGYIARIQRHSCIDLFKKEKKLNIVSLNEVVHGIIDDGGDIDRRNRVAEYILGMMDTILSPTEYKIFNFWLLGYPYEEIAEEMDTSKNHVGTAIYKAIKKLKKEFLDLNLDF